MITLNGLVSHPCFSVPVFADPPALPWSLPPEERGEREGGWQAHTKEGFIDLATFLFLGP